MPITLQDVKKTAGILSVFQGFLSEERFKIDVSHLLKIAS